uniref:Glutamate receptor n=1 Tax=Caenorhabditis tropicalis TaxID=1561998 RepID=A0A1I7UJL3_9PELO
MGVSAIILPQQYEGHMAAAAIVQSIADRTNVPCVSLHLSPPVSIHPSTHLHPHLNAKSLAVAAFIKREKWRDVVVVFEESDELLEVTDMITAGHFDPDSFSSQLVRLKHGDDYGNELKHIKNKLDRYRIVINIPLTRALHFLEQAANLSMCGVLYHYVIMDMYTTSIWIDTLRLLIRSMKSVHVWDEPRCGMTWAAGSDIKRKFFEGFLAGVSGDLYWAPSGERSNYTLHVYRRKLSTFQKFAEWSSRTRRIASSDAVVISNSTEKLTLEGKHLKISVYLEAPFVMMTSNGSYEGYCIDLLHKIANILKFTYTIQKVRDNAYGSKESNGKWSGMVGELQRGDADLAVASLTISYGRSEVIDFTVPYMHLGISILFKKPRITDSDWFKFMDPLSTQVWIMTFASYFIVSIAIWIIAKISPYEQFEKDENNGQYKPVDNQFSLRNSFWFTVCSLMQQGSELCPRAASTRLLTAIWWFFALILISSYTANLAAVLTTRRMETPIENADDLAAQTKIKYGTLGRGSTMSFFNIGGLIDQKGYGIGLPKGSPYRELISTAILRLQEKTELTELKEKWWKDKSVVCEQPKRKDQDDGESIGGIFIILVVGLFLTAILVIFELITTRKPSPAQSQVIRHVNVIPTFRFDFFK